VVIGETKGDCGIALRRLGIRRGLSTSPLDSNSSSIMVESLDRNVDDDQ
jgi:hypothetical protein